jgi:UDP-N-acetylmuramate dehydrogenase
MSWSSEFADRIERDAPIGRSTWYRLGGTARYLFHPHDTNDLAALMTRARQEDVPFKVLGAGANVLVSDDGYDGVVVRLDTDNFRTTTIHKDPAGDEADVVVGAGVDLPSLARRCSERGLSGLECMAGIPGSVGGAVCMNAGGRPGEFGDVVREVETIDLDGNVETLTRRQVGFTYRHTGLGQRVVLSARLALKHAEPERVKATFDALFQEKSRAQPLGEKSAGCIFKNPEGHAAGALIDRSGLKGTRCGGAEVSHRHANFIVAHDGATASDVLELIDLIRERVRQDFGVELEEEIDIWRPTGSRPTRG